MDIEMDENKNVINFIELLFFFFVRLWIVKVLWEEKVLVFVKVLSEWLVEGFILVGSYDNIIVVVVFLSGCLF